MGGYIDTAAMSGLVERLKGLGYLFSDNNGDGSFRLGSLLDVYVCSTSSASLNIRTQPDLNSSVVAKIPKGAEVHVLCKNSAWAFVYYQGKWGYASLQYLKSKNSTVTVSSVTAVAAETKQYSAMQIYVPSASDGLPELPSESPVTPTVSTPDVIVHIDGPHGDYNGENHIEISGWIASRYDLTYVMAECEAFGQMNLTGNLSDASAELDAAGYSAYVCKKRFRSVINKKDLQPNTAYTLKVWAGMINGAVSGVCSQRFNVTSVKPVVVGITAPSSKNLTGGSDVTVSGYILSNNPITDVSGRLADINGSSQTVDFDVSFSIDSARAAASASYDYGYSFTGKLSLALVNSTNTTASIFVTATDSNGTRNQGTMLVTLGSVVRGDINSYRFSFNQSSVRVTGSGSQTLTGTVYSNAPIAAVMVAITQKNGENNNKQIQLNAAIQETTPPSDYKYAKTFSLPVTAGDLCNVLDVDSFSDKEFNILFWTVLVNNSGNGEQKFASGSPALYGSNVTIPSYTLSYNANGGSGAPSSQTFKYGSNGKGVTVSAVIPTRVGFSFRGWTDQASSQQVKYVPGNTFNTNRSTTLYAVWEKAAMIPTSLISYNVNASVTIKNAPKVFKLVSSSDTKYRFTASGSAGASVVIQNASGSTIASMSGASTVTKDVALQANGTYYIVVSPSQTGTTGTVTLNILRGYEITFDADLSTAPGPISQFAGEEVTMPTLSSTPTPVKVTLVVQDDAQGYRKETQKDYPVSFARWANYEYRNPVFWYAGESTEVNETMKLQAEWNYSAFGAPAVELPTGKILTGWVNENGNRVHSDDLMFDNTVLYAVLDDKIPLEGIRLSPKTMTVEVGDEVLFNMSALPTGALRPAVIWSGSNAETAAVNASTGLVTVLSEGVSIITAVTPDGLFSAEAVLICGDGELTLSYNPKGGVGIPDALTQSYTQPFIVSDIIPQREGYSFLGWSHSEDGSGPLLQPGDTVRPDRDCTLYAVWEPYTFILIYDANGGENAPDSQLKTYDVPVVLTDTVPVRDGFIFEGWMLDPIAATADYLPGDTYTAEHSATLYALWRERAHSVMLNYTYLALTKGEERILNADILPSAAADTALVWSSSDDTVVSVADGRLTAIGAGRAEITVTVADEPSVSASCRVTVGDRPASGMITPPETETLKALPGETVQVAIRFASAYAAYAKVVFSYDETKLQLVGSEAAGSWATVGNNCAVLAIADGKIADGVQAVLTFRVAEDLDRELIGIDVTVTECYTIDEIASTLFAVSADSVQIGCREHVPSLIAPVVASRETEGLGMGLVCSVCGEEITPQAVILPEECLFLPNRLTDIGEEAFAQLSAKQVVIPEGVSFIGSRAFGDGSGLLIAMIPDSVTFIADDALEGCDNVCLCGPADSIVQFYAIVHDIPFFAID